MEEKKEKPICDKCNKHLIPLGDSYIHPPEPCPNVDGWQLRLKDKIANVNWEKRYGAPDLTFQDILEIKEQTIKEAVKQKDYWIKNNKELSIIIDGYQKKLDVAEADYKEQLGRTIKAREACNHMTKFYMDLSEKWWNRLYFWLKKHGKT